MSGAATDNDILTLPKRFTGLVRRLRVRNDSGAARTITFRDRFTPDASAGVSSPSTQTIDRYGKVIDNATEWELDGAVNPIFKLLGLFRITLDTASSAVIVSYEIELI